MKHKEIEVWVMKDIADQANENAAYSLVRGKPLCGEQVKAKLIIPVEPEIVEFESAVKRLLKREANDLNSGVFYPNDEDLTKLQGKRWRIVATEVCE